MSIFKKLCKVISFNSKNNDLHNKKNKGLTLDDLRDMAKEDGLSEEQIFALHFGGGLTETAKRTLEQIDRLSQTHFMKRQWAIAGHEWLKINSNITQWLFDNNWLDISCTNINDLRNGCIRYPDGTIFDVRGNFCKIIVEDTFETPELFINFMNWIWLKQGVNSIVGDIDGNERRNNLSKLLGKSLDNKKDASEIEKIFENKNGIDEAIKWFSSTFKGDEKSEASREFYELSDLLQRGSKGSTDHIRKGLGSGEYIDGAEAKILVEMSLLQNNLQNLSKSNMEHNVLIKNISTQLDMLIKEKFKQEVMRAVQPTVVFRYISYGEISPGNFCEILQIEKTNEDSSCDERYIVKMRYDSAIKVPAFVLFSLDRALYLMLIDKLIDKIMPYIDKWIEEAEHNECEDVLKELNLSKKKLDSLRLSSNSKGEVISTELALIHIGSHISSGMMTDKDCEDILNLIGIKDLPMENKIGKCGAFEYLIKADFPTIDGKKKSKRVSLAEDYLWVVHPEIKKRTYNNENISKKEAIKIISEEIN